MKVRKERMDVKSRTFERKTLADNTPSSEQLIHDLGYISQNRIYYLLERPR